jgi:hypothetical protein
VRHDFGKTASKKLTATVKEQGWREKGGVLEQSCLSQNNAKIDLIKKKLHIFSISRRYIS